MCVKNQLIVRYHVRRGLAVNDDQILSDEVVNAAFEILPFIPIVRYKRLRICIANGRILVTGQYNNAVHSMNRAVQIREKAIRRQPRTSGRNTYI